MSLKKLNIKDQLFYVDMVNQCCIKIVNIISKKLSEASFVEVVTNGDTLKPKKIKELYMNNVNKLLISMYDGEHQRRSLKI